MKNGQPYIAIAQTNPWALVEIDRSMSAVQRRSYVVGVTRPIDLLELIKDEEVDIVIAGERFYPKESMQWAMVKIAEFKKQIQGLDSICFYPIEEESLMDGTELSEEIYKTRPNIIYIRYSSLSGLRRGNIVGELKKDPRSFNIPEIPTLIASGELGDILTRKDWKRLRRTFPEIQFYDELEEEHPS